MNQIILLLNDLQQAFIFLRDEAFRDKLVISPG